MVAYIGSSTFGAREAFFATAATFFAIFFLSPCH